MFVQYPSHWLEKDAVITLSNTHAINTLNQEERSSRETIFVSLSWKIRDRIALLISSEATSINKNVGLYMYTTSRFSPSNEQVGKTATLKKCKVHKNNKLTPSRAIQLH